MKCLEIISLRTSGPFEGQALEYLRDFCSKCEKHGATETDIYANVSIPGDMAIVISSQGDRGKEAGTNVGVILADALKRFGLVDHTCWFKLEET